MSKKKKVFNLTWVFDPMIELDSFFTKKMFGGLAAYCHDKMVMLITETPGKTEYRGVQYEFEIWDGIMYPTEHEYQPELKKLYPQLITHPVLKKWLYLPLATENFEDIANNISEEILNDHPKFGIYPKLKD